MKLSFTLGVVMALGLVLVWFVLARTAHRYWPNAINFGMSTDYTAKDVLAMFERHPDETARYVMPGLFPIDVLFLACLGSALALLSFSFAAGTPIPPNWLWAVLVFPTLYMIADLSENLLLARLLGAPAAITDAAVATVQVVSHAKHWLIKLAGVQIILLGLWALVHHLGIGRS